MKIEVEFKHWIEPEDIPFEGNVMASGDDNVDLAQENWVRDQLNSGNEAAWCYAIVTAEVVVPGGPTFLGRDAVGGMSWESEKQLWKDNLKVMEAEALADLFSQMRRFLDDAAAVGVALDQLLEQHSDVRWVPEKRR